MSRKQPRFNRNNPTLPTIPAGFFLFQITAIGQLDNQLMINNFAYMNAVAGSLSTSPEANLAAAFCTTVVPSLRGCLAQDASITAVKCACLNIPTRIPVVNTTASQLGIGTSSGTSHLDSEMAVVISKYTSTKGQHGRGRNYIGAVPSTFVSTTAGQTNVIISTVTAYNTLASNLQASLADGTVNYLLSIFQRVPGGSAVGHAQNCTTVIPRSLLGTVRRRRIGRGK